MSRVVVLGINTLYFILNKNIVIFIHIIAGVISFFLWYAQVFELLFMSQVLSFMGNMMTSLKDKASFILFSYIYSVTIIYVFTWGIFAMFQGDIVCEEIHDCLFLVLNFNKTSNGGLSEILFGEDG